MAASYWVAESGSSSGIIVGSLGGGGGGGSVGGVVGNQNFASAGYTIPDPNTSGTVITQGIASANCPFTYPTPAAGKQFYIVHQQPPSGSTYTPSFPANVQWAGNQSPVWSNNGYADRIHNLCVDGTNWEAEVTPGFKGAPVAQVVGNGFTAVNGSATSIVLPVTSTAASNIFLLGCINYSTKTVSSVTGGNVGTWQHIDGGGVNIYDADLWMGVITSTGSASITVTWSGTAGGRVTAQEMSTLAGSFALDQHSHVAASSPANPYTLPSLTCTYGNELGAMSTYLPGPSSTNLPAGYQYPVADNSGALIFNTNLFGTQAPSLSWTGTATYLAAGLGLISV